MADLFGKPTGGIGTDAGVTEVTPDYPDSFWANLLANPGKFAGGGRATVSIPGYPIPLTVAAAAQMLQAGGLPPAWEATFKGVLQNAANEAWGQLPPQKQQAWVEASATGNPHDPDSDEGKLYKKEYEEKQVQKRDELDFTGWEEGEFADLQATIEQAATGDQAALAKLEAAIADYKNPELAEYIGDYVSQAAQAYVSPETLAQQQASLDKLWGQTDVQETAEEKLMREMARRQQEQDLKAQRGAFANDLQARGVYGSGAELTMNLSAMQEAANRRALEEMKANANAQTRAMDALSQHGDLSARMRGQEAQEVQFRGTAADRAAEFNKNLRFRYNEWLAGEQRKNNQAPIDLAKILAEQTSETGKNAVGNKQAAAGLGLQGTIGGVQARHGIVQQIGGTQGAGVNLANADETEEEIST